MKSQKQLILEYLQAGNSINHKHAERDPSMRCTRLAARICDLRRLGYNIVTTTIKHRSKSTGRLVAYATYTLV